MILPDAPELPSLKHIFDLWTYSDSASEITAVFQNFFSRLPSFVLAFFALSFFFIVIPLIIRIISEVL